MSRLVTLLFAVSFPTSQVIVVGRRVVVDARLVVILSQPKITIKITAINKKATLYLYHILIKSLDLHRSTMCR